MEDDLKKKGRRPQQKGKTTSTKNKWKTALKNGRRPKKKWKTA